MSGSSDKCGDIAEVVGSRNEIDIKHLDSAHLAGCKVFLTSDKGDLVSKREPLELLLGIKVLHFVDDWNEFIEIVQGEQT